MSAIVSSTQTRGGFSVRLLAALLVTLAAPLAVYLVARTAIVGLKPALGANFPPAEYSPLLRRLMPAVADPRRPVPAPILALARRAAVQEPLANEPFFILARGALDRRDLRLATKLMEEARRRRPNQILTRLLLISLYGTAGRYSDALAEMDYALRSSESVQTAVFPELVKTMRTAQGRRALADILANRPDWRENFILTLKRQALLDPEQAGELLATLQARRPRDDWSPERDLYIDALIRSGRVAQARALWLETLPKADRARYRTIFGGDFGGTAPGSAFAWLLHDETAGRAEISRSGPNSYLQVDYFGGQNVVLAEQLLGLSPGAYQLAVEGRSDEGIKSGDLYWSVSCVPEGQELLRLRLNRAQPAYRPFQGQFSVPASGCSGQRLRLVADAGDVTAGYTAQIRNMRLVQR